MFHCPWHIHQLVVSFLKDTRKEGLMKLPKFRKPVSGFKRPSSQSTANAITVQPPCLTVILALLI